MIERIMEPVTEPELKQKDKSLDSIALTVRHIYQVKPLKDQRHSKSKTLNVKGGEGCLPIR